MALAPKKTLEELREERRRARRDAFWTPFITLASIVGSVAMLMFLARTCRERFPQFSPPATTAPARNQPSTVAPAQDSNPTPPENGAVKANAGGTP